MEMADRDGAVASDAEAAAAEEEEGGRKEEGRATMVIEASVESQTLVRVRKYGETVEKGMQGASSKSTNKSFMLCMRRNQPRQIAKRDWPPGCGPCKGAKRRAEGWQIQPEKLLKAAEDPQARDNASVEEDLDREDAASKTGGAGIHSSKPVATKTAFKRTANGNAAKAKDFQVSRAARSRSASLGADKDSGRQSQEIKQQENLWKRNPSKGNADQRKIIKKENVKNVKKDGDAKNAKGWQKIKQESSLEQPPIAFGSSEMEQFINDPHDVEARELVRQTLKMYDTLRRKIQRDEEDRAAQIGTHKRSDLKAATLLNEKKLSINRVKKIGYIPGVEVGDHFYFRAELCIIGLHRQIQGGIDFISGKETQWGHPVAASITASGGYEDDIDDGETMIYTGQGGNNYKGDRRQQEDQKLERGNLALENCCRLGLPVRVIRGCKDKSSPSGTIYTYDGLYMVKESWLDRGVSGFGVYKFKLQRIPAQPPLGSAIVRFVGSLKTKPSKREGVVIPDISGGQETIPVCVVNEVDDIAPVFDNFEYIIRVSLPKGFVEPPPCDGCSCKKSCSSGSACRCIRKNGGKAPYIDGLLVEAKNVVYECGVKCGCPPTCHNRVTQHGIKHKLEIFKTKQKGWGVRSWDSVPSGSFICEYIGELVDSQEAEQRIDNDEYLFDLDLIKGNKARGVDVSMFFDEAAEDADGEVEDANLSLDASNYGNVGRFVNHSCLPNLFAQCVLFDHDDLRIPHIMLFAMENIPPLTELTYDYGYTVGQVMDSAGNVKVKACHCGEKVCKGRMY